MGQEQSSPIGPVHTDHVMGRLQKPRLVIPHHTPAHQVIVYIFIYTIRQSESFRYTFLVHHYFNESDIGDFTVLFNLIFLKIF